MQTEEPNSDLAKYLNRDYWERRKLSDTANMVTPTAPSPLSATPQPSTQAASVNNAFQTNTMVEQNIDEFAADMRTQVEIFVNRMKSDSSRGRSIANDSAVQTLFMNLTSLHSQQLSYIKMLDDKRMWYEQLQDKMAQIKDSRAALDVLRQEHVEKLKRIAEEQERQRQIQMAQKLEIMRKKKQEYLQYQRELALQRIQEQEREMQLRQEQQMVQYRMGQTFPFMSALNAGGLSRPVSSSGNGDVYNPYMTTATGSPTHCPMPTQYNQVNSNNPMGAVNTMPGMFTGGSSAGLSQAINVLPGHMQTTASSITLPGMMATSGAMGMTDTATHQMQPAQQYLHQPHLIQQIGAGGQVNTSSTGAIPSQQHLLMAQNVVYQQSQNPALVATNNGNEPVAHSAMAAAPPLPTATNILTSNGPSVPLQQVTTTAENTTNPNLQLQQQIQTEQMMAINAAPAPPQNEPEPVIRSKVKEPAMAELISFD